MGKEAEEVLPKTGTPEFWEFYDQFCQPENLQAAIEDPKNPLPIKMRKIMTEAQLSNDRARYTELERPERNWGVPRAWLALDRADLCNNEGFRWGRIQPGDVFIREFQWDRDVMITQSPLDLNHICGSFRGGKENIGLYIPLYSKAKILECIRRRLERNTAHAMSLAEEESRDWGWPP